MKSKSLVAPEDNCVYYGHISFVFQDGGGTSAQL